MVKRGQQVKHSLKEYLHEAPGGPKHDSTAARIQSLTEKFAATPVDNGGGHRAGVTADYNKYNDNRGYNGYSYPPPPPPPPHGYAPEYGYGPYGQPEYTYGPGHYVGPHAGLPPPPPPPPPSGTQQYNRGAPPSMADERELYMSLPPPPPSAGVSQYGHLRANFAPSGYPPAPVYSHTDMPPSALYGMPPPPPPPPHPPARGNGQRHAGDDASAAHSSHGHQQRAGNGHGAVHSNGHHHVDNGSVPAVQGSKAQQPPASRIAPAVLSNVEQRPAEAAHVAHSNGQQHFRGASPGSVPHSNLVVADPQLPSVPTAVDTVIATPAVPPSPVKEESIPVPVTAPAEVEVQVCTEVPLLGDTPVESVHSTVKNAFAERLAQQALARLASRASGTVRTDLLGETSGLGLAPVPVVKAADPPKEPAAVTAPRAVEPVRVAEKQAPAAPAARVPAFSMTANGGEVAAFRPTRTTVASVATSVSSERGPGSVTSGDEPAAAAALVEVGEPLEAGGDDASSRQRLKLQPRTLPLDAAAAGAAMEEARRKLKLQPRTKDTAAVDDRGRIPIGSKELPTATSGSAPKGSSIFGAARPREEVLKERGVDPSSTLDLDLGLGLGRPSYNAGAAHHGYGSANLSGRGSRAASIASGISGDDHGRSDDWKKVNRSRAREDMYIPMHHDTEPLLGVFSGPGQRGASTRFFAEGNSGYVSAHNNGGWQDGYGGHPSSGYGRNADLDDGLVIRRSLPIRSDF